MSERFDTRSPDVYDPTLYRFDVVADSVRRFADVGDAQVELFRLNGYLVIREAFGPPEVEAALAGLQHLIEGKNPAFHGVQFESWARERLDEMSAQEKQDAIRKLSRFSAHDERLKAIAHDPALLDVVRRLVGGEPAIFQDQALIKPPGRGTEKPWHQDKAFFNIDVDAPVVGVWMALDPATAENGCMHVIPGSHRDGPVPHFRRRDFQICDADVETARDVIVPLEPGGLLFFDGLIHHGTPANRSPNRRRALQFHYTTADARWLDEAYRLGVFGSEGSGAAC